MPNNFLKRIVTSFFLIITLLIINFASSLIFISSILILGAIVCYEFNNIFSKIVILKIPQNKTRTKKINFTVKDVDINKSLLIRGIKLKIISKNLISATYEKGSLDFREMIDYLNQNEIKIEDISTEEGDLEDVFVQLTKH